jgi:hypothetical protein
VSIDDMVNIQRTLMRAGAALNNSLSNAGCVVNCADADEAAVDGNPQVKRRARCRAGLSLKATEGPD